MYGFILIYLITATAAVAAFRRPLIGLYAYVGFAILRPQSIWGFAGDFSGISYVLGVALLIGWALNGFGSWRLGRGRPIVVALLAFTAWLVLSASQALDQTRALALLPEVSKLILPFLVGVTMMKGEKDWRPLLWTIVLAQGYVGLEMNMNYLLKGYNMAAIGFGGMDNNCFGVSLLCVLGPAIALAVSSKTWQGRSLAAAAAVLILHTILLTFSRGALIGLLAVAATAVVMMPKRPKYIFAFLLMALLAVRLTGPQLAARYATAFASEEARDGSAESRFELWRDCLSVVEAFPVFGVGPGNWRVIAASYGWPEGKSAHSVWMETAAEVGVPGVLALMLFFGTAIVKLWPIARTRQTETNRYEVVLASGVVLSTVGFAVAGQFVSVPGLEVPYYVVMLGVALLTGTTREAVADAPVKAIGRQSPYQPAPARLRPLPAARSVTAKR